VTHCAGRKWRGVTHPSWERSGGGWGGHPPGWEASESGLYGLDSPLQAAAGVLVLPDGRDSFNACSARTNFSGAPPPGGGSPGWLALIQRGGGCSFADKIRLAAERGAAAAVIYNYRGTGNEVLPMSHHGAENIVAIMIGNLKGMEILHRIESGMKVTMVIEVGKKHGPWMNQYSIFFISVSFFIVTAATMGYFVFYSARRLRIARAQSRTQVSLCVPLLAIEQLQLRTLKQGDKETGPDGDSCVVCIELYKPNEVVRILTCNHLFHKNCIDPWLLEHRTCPMCKCDILKALGVEYPESLKGECVIFSSVAEERGSEEEDSGRGPSQKHQKPTAKPQAVKAEAQGRGRASDIRIYKEFLMCSITAHCGKCQGKMLLPMPDAAWTS
uniref:Ring finger protein 128 n=1 Tax=Strix occidentalis caurina TaxID=311401 RepID=A0A8D0F8C0_STROC